MFSLAPEAIDAVPDLHCGLPRIEVFLLQQEFNQLVFAKLPVIVVKPLRDTVSRNCDPCAVIQREFLVFPNLLPVDSQNCSGRQKFGHLSA